MCWFKCNKWCLKRVFFNKQDSRGKVCVQKASGLNYSPWQSAHQNHKGSTHGETWGAWLPRNPALFPETGCPSFSAWTCRQMPMTSTHQGCGRSHGKDQNTGGLCRYRCCNLTCRIHDRMILSWKYNRSRFASGFETALRNGPISLPASRPQSSRPPLYEVSEERVDMSPVMRRPVSILRFWSCMIRWGKVSTLMFSSGTCASASRSVGDRPRLANSFMVLLMWLPALRDSWESWSLPSPPPKPDMPLWDWEDEP